VEKNARRRRFFFFSKKSNDASPITSATDTVLPNKGIVQGLNSNADTNFSDELTTAGTIETADITAATDESSIYYMDMSPNRQGNSNTAGSDAEFRTKQTKDTSDTNSLNGNFWKDEPLHVGRFIASRQGSETSELTAISRRSSSSSSYSSRSIEGESTRASSSSGASVSSSQSDESDKSKTTLPAIFNLKEPLCAIPDNSFHSTVTEELSRSSMHGSSLHGSSMHGSSSKHGNEAGGTVNLNSIREDLEMQLKLRTCPIEDDHVNLVSTPPAPSPVSMKFTPKSRSFLSSIPKKNFLLRASSEPDAPTAQSNPKPTAATRAQSVGVSFHTTPITEDPALEETSSVSVVPADAKSLALESSQDNNKTNQLVPNIFTSVPHEEDADLIPIHVNPSDPTMVSTEVTSDLDDSLQDMYSADDDIRHTFSFEIDTEVCPIYASSRPSTANSGCPTESSGLSSEDEGHVIRSRMLNERSSTVGSGCTTVSSGSSCEDEGHVIRSRMLNERSSTIGSGCPTVSSGSSSEDDGHMIRSRMLDGNDFDSLGHMIRSRMLNGNDSDSDTNSDTTSEAHSLEKGSVTKDISYRRLDDNATMEDRSLSSTDSSYHFPDLSQQLQDVRMSTDADEHSNLDSEVATASSDDDVAQLEQLYSDIFEDDEDDEDEDRLKLLQSASFSEEESDLSTGTLSMLGLFHDGESYESSAVSFDSTKFFKDVPCGDSISKNCSISMHDITTIHEENEDDIAEEDSPSPLPMDDKIISTPLDGELRMPRREYMRQGTAGTSGTGISSVTDDSYMCMSFDSLSMDSACSYDSFSSDSVSYMVDVLKEETERKRSKIRERIAKIQESTDKLMCNGECVTSEYVTSDYVASRLMGKGGDEDSILS